MSVTLTGVLADHVKAVNAFDVDAIVDTFADDALVNDARREFWGREAIRAWVQKEMVGDKVTLEPVESFDHYDQTILRAKYDGEYDKSKLPPGDLIMTNYCTIRDAKIATLIVIRNTPAGA